ncbi:MAG: ankyrin repeat domain-containing protein [Filimonas sp.]|nr:ankyrin repeat domain-containing protein [Filimonas sp.]
MAKKKKTLPKNFSELIEAGDIAALMAVFDTCELDATGGYTKETALSFYNVPDELVRWLVQAGANIDATDTYKRTALHQHAMRRSGSVAVFLELGADIAARDNYGDTPLHMAAGSSFSVQNVQVLVQNGADIAAKNDSGETPLVHALKRANNMDIRNLTFIADILLQDGIPVTEEMQKAVTRIGENFEFHRAGFNKEYLPATDEALSLLYQKFNTPPVKTRQVHDGVSPIIVPAGKWQDQYSVLWDLLIPSGGPAKTVQGEVVRITGKVRDEIYRNGGANWDADFKKMLDALIVHFGTGVPLSEALLTEAKTIAKEVSRTGDGEEDLSRLCELATAWVVANPGPVALSKPEYKR